jgi:hypothetical protein
LEKKWEANRKALFKQKIIKYNQEDCEALLLLKQKIILIINKEIAKTDGNILNVIHTDDIKPPKNYNLLVNKCAFPEMNFINKSSYFDYQREKVNARKNLILKKQ